MSPTNHEPLKDTALFSPVKIGQMNLSHRVVLAPLTRMRAEKESDGVFVHGDLGKTYYSQRASKGGLLLTEATDICLYASGYPGVPGVFTPSQLAGWRVITSAVHAKGGYIFCQLWHTGRASPPSFRNGARAPSSSDIPISGKALDGSDYASSPPKPMSVEEIGEVTEEWASAAKRAVEEGGFDGVEIHGANGYLLDQFLHSNVNRRTDAYGGSIANRCRFPLEVLTAVASAIGASRVGIRLSPYNYFQDTKDSDPVATWSYLCERIKGIEGGIAYVHMVEPRFDETLSETAKLDALSAYTSTSPTAEVTRHPSSSSTPSLTPFRTILCPSIPLLTAGGFTPTNAAPAISNGSADAIVFGRLFLANPDLPRRLKEGRSLNGYDRGSFYGPVGEGRGYVDYPILEGEDGEERAEERAKL
ncbi:FMN-linked oxidoreductase [Aulographum hederae CBS 113979]|uniref:FMN-linked oxidoreductase n=1 Tax=Aulographum hederae CBS 113979 TaxID=1176131 RepID=A0A6G1GPJ6_9PEZI|nr:FMN-linked oxidoreductase [Aulographum hederae CBS 113979]